MDQSRSRCSTMAAPQMLGASDKVVSLLTSVAMSLATVATSQARLLVAAFQVAVSSPKGNFQAHHHAQHFISSAIALL